MMTRKSVFMQDREWEMVEQLKKEYDLKSIGAVFSYLLENYSVSQNIDEQANKIADIVLEKQKSDIELLRNRTGFTDKSTKVILHMLNDLVINNNLDMKEEHILYSFTKTPSILYRKSKSAVEDEIRSYQKKKIEGYDF